MRSRRNSESANQFIEKKSSVTIVNEAGDEEKQSLVVHRDDFWASTSNKQLNFLQHVFTILKQHGRAAIVVPDNVLFEGGAGETVRRELLKRADVHTLLRLPTGIFYAKDIRGAGARPMPKASVQTYRWRLGIQNAQRGMNRVPRSL